MKRVVTLTFSADFTDTEDLSLKVAEILEKHASEIRDKDSLAGKTQTGFLSGNNGYTAWRVDWVAKYE